MSDPNAAAPAAAADAAAAAPAAPAPAAQPAAAPPAAKTEAAKTEAPPAAGPGEGPYRPQGLAEEMIGKSDRETIDRLAERFAGLRQKLAERGAPPETPEGYSFAFDGELAPYAASLDSDPVFAGIKREFHAAGVTDKQAQGIVGGVMKALMEAGQLDAPFDPVKEAQALFPEEKDAAQLKARVARAVGDNQALLQQLQARGLTPRAAELAASLQDRAGGVELVQYMARLGQPGGPLTDGAPPTAITEASLRARLADPRNKTGDAKFDPAFAAETNRQYQSFYGDAETG